MIFERSHAAPTGFFCLFLFVRSLAYKLFTRLSFPHVGVVVDFQVKGYLRGG